jgi:hypothetical protein
MQRVYVELGKQRAFACAVDWPGWCRAGKTEELALEALAAAEPRYARVASEAGVRFSPEPVEVVERVTGSANTDFGVPGEILEQDRAPLSAEEAERLASLVAAAWRELDRTAAAAGATATRSWNTCSRPRRPTRARSGSRFGSPIARIERPSRRRARRF